MFNKKGDVKAEYRDSARESNDSVSKEPFLTFVVVGLFVLEYLEKLKDCLSKK